MVMGHYATALIPYAYESNRKLAPFWFFLLISQFLDFIMVTLVIAGIETIKPEGFFDASFLHMSVDMTYSHDILPVLIACLLLAGLSGLIFKSLRLASIVLGLVLLHELLDLLVGFQHFWFGIPSDPGSATVFGLGLYNSNPVLGILAEAAMCAAILLWYLRRRRLAGHALSRGAQGILWAVLVAGTLCLLPMANQSLASLFGQV